MNIEDVFIVTKEVFSEQLKTRTVNTFAEGRERAIAEGKEDQFTLTHTALGRELKDDDVLYFAFSEKYDNADVDMTMEVVVIVEDEFPQYEVSPFQASMAMVGMVGAEIPRLVLKKNLTGKMLEAKQGLIEMGEADDDSIDWTPDNPMEK